MSRFHFTRERVLFELPEVEGQALLAWCGEADPWLVRDSAGYIAQEIESPS